MKTSERYSRSGSCIAVIWDLCHEILLLCMYRLSIEVHVLYKIYCLQLRHVGLGKRPDGGSL